MFSDPPQTSWLLHSPCFFSFWDPLWRITSCSCYSAQLDWIDWRLNGWPIRTWFYFKIHLPNDLDVWILHHHMKCTFTILNSSASEDIGSCRFPEYVYKPTFEKQEGTSSHLRRYFLLYCWIRSTRDSAISYICKGHIRSCWLHQVFIFPGRQVLSIDFWTFVHSCRSVSGI